MFKNLLGKRPTNKSDVVLACVTALLGVWKAYDTYTEYKAEQKEIEQ